MRDAREIPTIVEPNLKNTKKFSCNIVVTRTQMGTNKLYVEGPSNTITSPIKGEKVYCKSDKKEEKLEIYAKLVTTSP